METELARHHQLHGAQPVLPVPDVNLAADWFGRVLGFRTEFVHGEPALHARIKLGDRSWGDPIYIHLARSTTRVQPCGELRLHVGNDIDGLHAACVAAGEKVLMAPTDQPWGLREFSIEGPAGHHLRLCGEAGVKSTEAAARTVIVAYRPKPGQPQALLELLRGHVPTLQALGLATDRAPMLMRSANGTLIEVFEWASPAAMERAHKDAQVQALWEHFATLCDFETLAGLPEAGAMFAEFEAL